MSTAPANTSFAASGLGTNNGSLSGGTLLVNGGPIVINGETITSQTQGSLIPNIANISISNAGVSAYKYRIDVVGADPTNAYDIKLVFTDETADQYTLRIYNTSTQTHSLFYNSSSPTINALTWDA